MKNVISRGGEALPDANLIEGISRSSDAGTDPVTGLVVAASGVIGTGFAVAGFVVSALLYAAAVMS